MIYCDVYGTQSGFDIYMELPGVAIEDIDLEVTPLTVRIKGLKRRPCTGSTPLTMEIETGRFEREIPLPARVDTSSVSAKMRNGVLHITLSRKSPVVVSIPVQAEGNK